MENEKNNNCLLYTSLGRAGKELGVKFATPIFDGASMDDLNEWTDKAGLPRYCRGNN